MGIPLVFSVRKRRVLNDGLLATLFPVQMRHCTPMSGLRRQAMQKRFRAAILDDYQNVALSLADWSVLDGRATVIVFNDHVTDAEAVIERLQPFEIVCVMRERTPMTRSIIERLPKLRGKCLTSPGRRSLSEGPAHDRT